MFTVPCRWAIEPLARQRNTTSVSLLLADGRNQDFSTAMFLAKCRS